MRGQLRTWNSEIDPSFGDKLSPIGHELIDERY